MTAAEKKVDAFRRHIHDPGKKTFRAIQLRFPNPNQQLNVLKIMHAVEGKTIKRPSRVH